LNITGWLQLSARALVVLLIVLMCADRSLAYSVLTHEEIVDLLWSDEIQPLLLKRYPGLTPERLRRDCSARHSLAVRSENSALTPPFRLSRTPQRRPKQIGPPVFHWRPEMQLQQG
jgi:hypothetical protein